MIGTLGFIIFVVAACNAFGVAGLFMGVGLFLMVIDQ